MALLDDVSLLKSFKSVIFKVVDTDTSCLLLTEPRVGVEGPDNFSFSPT